MPRLFRLVALGLIVGAAVISFPESVVLGQQPAGQLKQPGEPIEYQPFFPDRWKAKNQSMKLFPWEGEQVVLLTTTADFDPKTMATFLKRLDVGWKLYADLVGQSPRPFKQHNGKVTFACVPDASFTCGAGCGYMGMTGIEIAGFYRGFNGAPGDYDTVHKDRELFFDYYFYEMGRNYYLFGDRISLFSTGFPVAMRHVCMEDVKKWKDQDTSTRGWIDRFEEAFSKSNVSFEQAFAPFGAKAPFKLNDINGKPFEFADLTILYASGFLKLRKDNGGNEWVKQFHKHLFDCPPSSPSDISGAKGQLLNWVVAASLAAGKDLTPVFRDRWRFPLAPEMWVSLAKVDWKKPGLTADNVFDALPIDQLPLAVAMSRPTFVTPERRKQNLIVGGTFEDGSGGTWKVNTWRQNKAAATVVSSEAKEGRKSVAVRSPLLADDAMYEQTVGVKPNTRYLVSGWIKTKDVVVVEPGGQRGANLSIEGLNGEVSRSLQGTNDWSYVTLVVDSGQRTEVTVRARLGFHFSTAKGEAWFDDLCLIAIGETPTALAPQSSVASKAVVPRDPVSRIVPPAEAVIAAEATKASRPLTNGDFAAGLNGWQVEGGAKGFKTFTLGSEKALTTFGSKKEADTGRLYQCFQVPDDANELRFSLHGGMNMQTTFVALWNGTQLHQRIAAKNDNTPFQVVWNVVPLRGKVVTLEVVDNSSTAWGFIGAHGFKLVTQQLAAATTGKRPVKVTQSTQDDPLTVSLRGHDHAVLSLAVSPDGKSLASGDLYGSTLVWNVADRKLKFELPGTAGANIVGLAFSPDGKLIATGNGKSVKLWDATNGQELKTLSGHTDLIWSVAFSPDSKQLASGSHDKSVKVWDIAKGDEIKTLTGKDGAFLSVAFSPDGKWLAGATSYGESYVMLWETRNWKESQRLSPIHGQVWSIAFSPDSQRLVTASDSGRAAIWDVPSGDELLSLQDRQGQHGQDHMQSHRDKQMKSVAFNHDGSRIVTAADSGSIKIWDAKTEQKLHELSGHAKDARDAAFSPDGKWVASGGGDSLVKVWTLAGRPKAASDGTIVKALVDPQKARAELQSLQGTWRLTNGADFANQLPPALAIKDAHLVIKGETATLLVKSLVLGYLLTIDPTQSPKAFDMLGAEDIWREALSMGIYSLDRDTLQIVWQPHANERPKEFKPASPPTKESPNQPQGGGNVPILKFERMQEPLPRMDSVFDLASWQKASRELNKLRVRVQLGRLEPLDLEEPAGPGYVGIVDVPLSETDGTVPADVWKATSSVNFLVCNVSGLTDATLRQLTTHRGLYGLSLNGKSSVTKDGLALLKTCPHFTGVSLTEVPQSVEFLTALAESNDLRIIEINGPAPSPELLAAIARFKNVESLQLSVVDLTDDILIELAKLPNLRKLSLPKSGDFKLDKPNVTDKGLQAVKAMKKLKRLEMFGHGIDNAKLYEINEQLRAPR